MKPSIGRIVHFQREENDVLPAIILAVGVDNNYVDLNVFYLGGVYGVGAAPFFNGPEPAPIGTWFWPTRVE